MKEAYKENIIIAATVLRFHNNTRDPFIIAKSQGIEIVYCDLDPAVMKGSSYYSETQKIIKINQNCNYNQQRIICAHELGHIILQHMGNAYYKDNDIEREYCANLFAVTLLFNNFDFNCDLTEIPGYALQLILDINL